MASKERNEDDEWLSNTSVREGSECEEEEITQARRSRFVSSSSSSIMILQ